MLPIWNSDLSGEAKFTTTVALGQQLVFPVLVAGIVGLVISAFGHDGMPDFFRFLLWVWFVAALFILFASTWGAFSRLQRGSLGRYLVTALSVPGVIGYLAAANAGAIVGAAFGRKTEFTRTPKTGA